MDQADDARRELETAHAQALRVGDSPLQADRLADRLKQIDPRVDGWGLDEDSTSRIRAALADAERVLRRDDDGREAARHLTAALALLKPRPRKPSPFLDD